MSKIAEAFEIIRNATVADADSLRELSRRAHQRATELERSQFAAGDWVEFEHNGYVIRGRVKSVNQKTLSLVDCVGARDGTTRKFARYRVGPGFAARVGGPLANV